MSLRRVLLFVSSLLLAGPSAAERLELSKGDNHELIASTSRGLKFEMNEPQVLLRAGGRLHVDAGGWERDDTGSGSNVKVRRGRLYLAGRIAEDFRFRVEREFAPAAPEFKNVFVQYRPTNRAFLTLGNFIAPIGLEQMMSSNHLTLMERDVSTSLGAGYQTGGRLDFNGSFVNRKGHHRFAVALASGIQPLGQVSNDLHRSKHVSGFARVVYAPVARRKRVVHFGLSGEYRKQLDDSPYAIFGKPETSLLHSPYLGTGRFGTNPALRSIDSVETAVVEAAVMKGPFLIQSEYHASFLQTNGDLNNPIFHGGYLQASWVVTGEHREYLRNAAIFGGLEPDSRWGAVELAARVSGVDLEDGRVQGGKAIDFTLGANWYIRSNLRLMFNYVHSEADQRQTSNSLSVDIAQARFQLHF